MSGALRLRFCRAVLTCTRICCDANKRIYSIISNAQGRVPGMTCFQTHAPQAIDNLYSQLASYKYKALYLTMNEANTLACRAVAVRREACVTAGTHRRLVSGALRLRFCRAVLTHTHVCYDASEGI